MTIITPTSPLPIFASGIFDPTGLVAGKQIICEDAFRRGLCGWTQLVTPTGTTGSYQPGGTVQLVTRAVPRLHLRTGDVTGLYGMAIKRVSANPVVPGRLLLEFVGNLNELEADLTRPSIFGWGLDFQPGSDRHFARIEFNNSTSDGTTRNGGFRWKKSDGSYVSIAGAQVFDGVDPLKVVNENKAGPQFYLAFVINTTDFYLEGFQFNSLKLGQCNPSSIPDDISAFRSTYGQAFDDTDLPTFVGGLNPFIDINNRSDAWQSDAASDLSWFRMTAIDNVGFSPIPAWEVETPGEELNFLFVNYAVVNSNTQASNFIWSAEFVLEPGYDYALTINNDAWAGTPTAGTFYAVLQMAPLLHHGLHLDEEAAAYARPWTTIDPTSAYHGALVSAALGKIADYSEGAAAIGRAMCRTIRGSANYRIGRLMLYSGGDVTGTGTPGLRVTAAVSRRLS